MNPLGASFIPAYTQPNITGNNSGVSELPQEFLTEGEYMFYDVTNDEDKKEEDSPELAYTFSRGELVRRDLEHLGFCDYETEHFIFKYLPDSDAASSLETIAEQRENAWQNICDIFFINPPEKHTFYLFQNDIQAYCPTWGKTFAGRALPEEHMAGIIYRNDPFFYESNNYGHELTHLLEFYLIKYLMRVPPYFREGMADLLSHSLSDLHMRYITFLKAGLVDNPFIISEEKFNNAEYMESGSFLKYISQVYSMQHLVEGYRRLGILQKGEKIAVETVSEIFTALLGTDLQTVMNNFYAYITSLWSTPLSPIDKEDENALRELFARNEYIVMKEDDKEINRLYSNDFYYTTPQSQRDIFIFHMIPMENMKAVDFEFYNLGSWLYGKSIAIKIGFENKLNGTRQTRVFASEKLSGTWRLSPKYVGGKEIF